MIAILQMKSIKLSRVEKGECMNSIEIKRLTKSFGDIKAVDDLSFTVEKGTFFSFLGVNGAGKSTTISMICGELTSDTGEIYIEGKDTKTHMNEVRTTIGVVYQTSALDDVLTVYDNLKYRAALYGITGNFFKKKLEGLVTRIAGLQCGRTRTADVPRVPYRNQRYHAVRLGKTLRTSQNSAQSESQQNMGRLFGRCRQHYGYRILSGIPHSALHAQRNSGQRPHCHCRICGRCSHLGHQT